MTMMMMMTEDVKSAMNELATRQQPRHPVVNSSRICMKKGPPMVALSYCALLPRSRVFVEAIQPPLTLTGTGLRLVEPLPRFAPQQ